MEQFQSKRRLSHKDNGEVEPGSGNGHHHQVNLRKRARTHISSQDGTGSGAQGPPKPMSTLEDNRTAQENGGRPRLHPLLIPMVMERVFEYCESSVADLKNYRLVCRAWEEASSDQWRKHRVVKLCWNETTKPRQGKDKGPLIPDFFKFRTSEMHQKFKGKSFRKVRIEGLKTTQENIRLSTNFYKVWKDFGTSIAYLHISGCTLRINEVTRLVNGTVNLKELVMTKNYIWLGLRKVGIKVSDLPEGLPKSITVGRTDVNAVRVVPNVEEINLVQDFPGDLCQSALSHLEDNLMEEDGRRNRSRCKGFKKLKRVDALHFPFLSIFSNSSYEQLMNLIRRIRLPPLEYLAVRIYSESRSRCDDQLKALVTTFHASLRTFKVLWDPIVKEKCEPSDNFPFGLHMLEMRQLYLWGNVTTSLHFLKFMPQLELLHISTYCFDKVDHIDYQCNCNSPYPKNATVWFKRTFQMDLVQKVNELGFDMTGVNMKSLTHVYIDCPLSMDSIGTLGVWMPRLKSLKIYVASGAHLRKVCETWPELEELVLLRESLIQDEDITEGLVNLKGLNRFGFDFLCKCNPTSLTEAAIHNGFLKMESLRNVTIPVHSEMNPEAEQALEAKCYPFPAKVIRNREPCRHQIFKSWIKADLDG